MPQWRRLGTPFSRRHMDQKAMIRKRSQYFEVNSIFSIRMGLFGLILDSKSNSDVSSIDSSDPFGAAPFDPPPRGRPLPHAASRPFPAAPSPLILRPPSSRTNPPKFLTRLVITDEEAVPIPPPPRTTSLWKAFDDK